MRKKPDGSFSPVETAVVTTNVDAIARFILERCNVQTEVAGDE